uniref:Uncharacterized protein n=1 Tax=Romanomermis culicivorax TaxID=13658 RepID=A0A915KY60_ROMCU
MAAVHGTIVQILTTRLGKKNQYVTFSPWNSYHCQMPYLNTCCTGEGFEPSTRQSFIYTSSKCSWKGQRHPKGMEYFEGNR